jgi:hypothetical protein
MHGNSYRFNVMFSTVPSRTHSSLYMKGQCMIMSYISPIKIFIILNKLQNTFHRICDLNFQATRRQFYVIYIQKWMDFRWPDYLETALPWSSTPAIAIAYATQWNHLVHCLRVYGANLYWRKLYTFCVGTAQTIRKSPSLRYAWTRSSRVKYPEWRSISCCRHCKLTGWRASAGARTGLRSSGGFAAARVAVGGGWSTLGEASLPAFNGSGVE